MAIDPNTNILGPILKMALAGYQVTISVVDKEMPYQYDVSAKKSASRRTEIEVISTDLVSAISYAASVVSPDKN